MRVTIHYGNTFDTLTASACTFSLTRAREIVQDALRTGHARFDIYLIEPAPHKELTEAKRKQFEKLRQRGKDERQLPN
jgi:hypothetical protein